MPCLVGNTGGVLLLRVQLPDRPGSLGSVATAMGTCGADISAIEIVEKGTTAQGQGYAVNDFMLSMPPHRLPDELVSACAELEGVQVLWLSRYPENWGLESDIDLLDKVATNPAEAAEILASDAPKVFHCQWAAVVAAHGAVARSSLAPDFTAESLKSFSGLGEVAVTDLPADWLPGWTESTVAQAPMAEGQALMIGRQGGPAFLASELRRLQHLAAMTQG